MESVIEDILHTEEDYYALPEKSRAELIDGIFYDMAAPSEEHQRILGSLFARIYNYIAIKKGNCRVYPAPFAVKLFDDDKTIVEPDISVICDKDKISKKGCSGAPDWVVEIVSPGNSDHDYIRKLKLYLKAGVREYWIINPDTRTVAVYRFFEDNLVPESYSFTDTVKAGIYDDLSIDFRELIDQS